MQYAPILNSPSSEPPAPFICSSCPHLPVHVCRGASARPTARVSREPVSYGLDDGNQKRKPRCYQRLSGVYETGRKPDLCYSLTNTWCIHSFCLCKCAFASYYSAVLNSLLLFAEFLFHLFLLKWRTDFLEGDSFLLLWDLIDLEFL